MKYNKFESNLIRKSTEQTALTTTKPATHLQNPQNLQSIKSIIQQAFDFQGQKLAGDKLHTAVNETVNTIKSHMYRIKDEILKPIYSALMLKAASGSGNEGADGDDGAGPSINTDPITTVIATLQQLGTFCDASLFDFDQFQVISRNSMIETYQDTKVRRLAQERVRQQVKSQQEYKENINRPEFRKTK